MLCNGENEEKTEDELLYLGSSPASLIAMRFFIVLSRKHHSKLMRALPDDFEQCSNSTWLIASRSLVEEQQNMEESRATAHELFADLFLSRRGQLIPVINLDDTCFCRGCKKERRAQHSTYLLSISYFAESESRCSTRHHAFNCSFEENGGSVVIKETKQDPGRKAFICLSQHLQSR